MIFVFLFLLFLTGIKFWIHYQHNKWYKWHYTDYDQSKFTMCESEAVESFKDYKFKPEKYRRMKVIRTKSVMFLFYFTYYSNSDFSNYNYLSLYILEILKLFLANSTISSFNWCIIFYFASYCKSYVHWCKM